MSAGIGPDEDVMMEHHNDCPTRRPVRLRPALLAAALALGLPTAPALAADAAPQGVPQSVLQQAQSLPEPQMAQQAQASFVLQGVEFVGATLVPESELQAAVAEMIGQSVTFADLQQLTVKAAAVYARHGYGLARVFVPVQEVVDGRIKLSVLEGKLGEVSIEIAEGAPIHLERVAGMLSVLKPGEPLSTNEYERAMLLLSDLPGIKPQSSVTVGASSQANDLRVHVEARDRFQFMLGLDNNGTRDSGRLRLTGSLRWSSPFERGDNLDLRIMAAQGMHTAFGRISYETPVGYSGLRIGGGLARVQYELGGPFAPLKPTGVGDVADLSFNYPLIRQRTTNLLLRGALERKSLTDRYETVGLETRKRVNGVSLGLALEHRDRWGGGGYNSANVQVYRGSLHLLDPMARVLDRPPFGYSTEGSFTKFTLQAARLQYLAPRWSLMASVGYQHASRNLDPYEKLSLGGPKAVRAYATGEVLVDDGWLGALELRFSPRPETTLYAFYDAARGDMYHRRRVFDPDLGRSLRGYGLGFSWSKPGSLSMNLSVAWRATGPGVTDGGDRNPRIYWSIQKAF
ncbi:ShlB/FhaC/HecB family hemolysin secretion/activation protein [Thermomonas sp.]|uniref:ShlB/FhaC/HecB family hemolysin secretion/activation protein n=1 Tax=Thermomonas sp. TaxID=1971895 RepID=UPI002CA7A06C|nr:ShlB/FhaC/HecB family hemolysin secretion/activation protein [Thermomonas sp.]HRO64180.1 ShlB/FhaC/HecB family hemolysin secretion/activation protein [Thermomonas sp.]